MALALAMPAGAQETDPTDSGRVTTAAYMVGAGRSRVLDTYLSQEHFAGPGFTFLAAVERRKPGRRWMTAMQHQADMASTRDRADMVGQLAGQYSFFWGRLRGWELLSGALSLQAGGMVNANIGFIYNTSNGNNPAQARLSLNVMPAAAAAYRFRIGRRRAAVRYEVQLPLAGVMFSPNYGQSYYEIFSRGDYDHNIVPTTFVSAPSLRQQIMAEVNISRRLTLRVGYLGDWQQASVNNLKSHIYAHRFMIGFVKRFKTIRYRP